MWTQRRTGSARIIEILIVHARIPALLPTPFLLFLTVAFFSGLFYATRSDL